MISTSRKARGAWSCHSQTCAATRGGRRGGNAIDLIAHMEGLTFHDAAKRAQELFGVQSSPPGATPKGSGNTGTHREVTVTLLAWPNPPTKTPELISEKDTGAGETGAVNAPLKFTLQGVDPAHPYLTQRGISEETARTFGVGFFPGKGSMAGRVVIPIHNLASELVAYAGRALEDMADKYKFPPGFHKSLELWNAHRVLAQTWPDEWAELVVIVEGFFDVMKLWQAGIPAVALMGSSLSDTQAKIISVNWYEAVSCSMATRPAACTRLMPRNPRPLNVGTRGAARSGHAAGSTFTRSNPGSPRFNSVAPLPEEGSGAHFFLGLAQCGADLLATIETGSLYVSNRCPFHAPTPSVFWKRV